jgi:hypothetical protein
VQQSVYVCQTHMQGTDDAAYNIYIYIYSRLSRLSRLIEEVESVRGKGG